MTIDPSWIIVMKYGIESRLRMVLPRTPWLEEMMYQAMHRKKILNPSHTSRENKAMIESKGVLAITAQITKSCQ